MKTLISLVLVAAPILIWFFVIVPRLDGKFGDTYKDLPFFQRQWARLVAFRTWFMGAVALVLPEIINAAVAVLNGLGSISGSGADISSLPDWLENIIRAGGLIAIVWNQARKTTPVDEPEA